MEATEVNKTVPPLIASLMRPGLLPGSGAGVQLLETHVSWVLLAGETAWKLKKPVNLGFLDFSTLELRHQACQEELRLNRRTVPELYLGVEPITGSEAAPQLGGPGPVLEYAVRMRRFPDAALLSTRLDQGQLEPALFEALGRHVAAFHAAAPQARPGQGYGDGAAIHGPVRQNFAQIRERLQAPALLQQLAAVEAWAEASFARLAPLCAERLARGRVRECHGDMHLGNMVLLDGAPRLFDALEFNPALRWTDVMADVAFLVMDLQVHGQAGYGWRFLNAWLEQSGDYEGLALLPYYLCYRAMVRAKVAAIRSSQCSGSAADAALAECRRYLDLALACTRPGTPRLLITCGVSGSGKSSQSLGLLELLGLVRLRADVERKRLAGLAPEASSASALGQGIYGAAMTGQTYARLESLVRTVSAAGFPVLVDATCLARAQRDRFRELAAALELPFAILAFEAPRALLEARVRQRAAAGQDASEADLQVLVRQLEAREAFSPEELPRVLFLDSSQPLDWLRRLPELERLG